jgi:DNA-binding LytR/AlgR family response regulator
MIPGQTCFSGSRPEASGLSSPTRTTARCKPCKSLVLVNFGGISFFSIEGRKTNVYLYGDDDVLLEPAITCGYV